jgi:hypothetical protein
MNTVQRYMYFYLIGQKASSRQLNPPQVQVYNILACNTRTNHQETEHETIVTSAYTCMVPAINV